MFDFLNKLRQRPPQVRLQITIIVSVVITGVVFVMWLFVVGNRFDNVFKNSSTKGEGLLPGLEKSFSDFGDVLKQGPDFSGAQELFNTQLQEVSTEASEEISTQKSIQETEKGSLQNP